MIEWIKANLFTLITATVAIYGAVLATLNYRHSRAEKKRRLNVELSGGFLTYGPGLGTELSEYKCFIKVSNPSSVAVTLRSVQILAGRLNIVVPPENGEPRSLPFEILPGQGFNFWVDAKGIAQGLAANGMSGSIKLRGVAIDGTGTHFTSKGVEFDIDALKRD